MSTLKYTGRLSSIEAGQVISIAGKVINNPQRFDVELTAGNGQGTDSGDIHLHISARFQGTEPVVVRNTHKKGAGWEKEERRENLIPFNSLNPFKRGGDFKIDIFVDQAAFFVTIDGKPFCTFAHRLPLHTIQVINIARDVEAVYQVNHTSAQVRPWPAVNPNTFEAFIPKQFNSGNVIVITGVPRGNPAGDFSVNFYDGSNRFRTHFHFRAYLSNRAVTVNSQLENGAWRTGTTVFPQPYPFISNQVFKLAIAVTNTEFRVAANGLPIISLPFMDHLQRLLGSMTGIELISDNGLNVEVQSIDFMKLDQTCSGFENFSKI
ncbi:32 kDa beta-galactoside-binding lectin lec-3-like [Chironomus tepperi]|uniref:32 kDa beta-galactoside-binding lectin lec-3-like n=1 Tax=Chironomus tepperi TaxID=113505 RepID=UPI00391F62A4